MPPVQNVNATPTVASAPAPVATVPPSQRVYTADEVQKLMAPKKDIGGIVKTILVVVLSLTSLTFIGLFVWMFMQYNDARATIDNQIAEAVNAAKVEQAAADEAEFLEREKEPFRDFAGPVDYGELSFKYPKTWSLYIARDAANGGDYEAYFNPVEVEAVSSESIYALKLLILNQSYESVIDSYRGAVDSETLNVSSITVNGTTGSRYDGVIPGTSFNGSIVVFKIRDKTVVFQTYSTLFESDFNKVIDSTTFNA